MSRRNIYYWKCDRHAAFHGTSERRDNHSNLTDALRASLQSRFGAEVFALSPAATQGNHLTWTVDIAGIPMFIRVEDGPERDPHLEMESAVMERVRTLGVPVPRVHAVDATWSNAPFAWQAIDRIPARDLNQSLDLQSPEAGEIAYAIGRAVAQWQAFAPKGFGVLDVDELRRSGNIEGFHPQYGDFFILRLQDHLNFLEASGFLSQSLRGQIESAIADATPLLNLEAGCLVHKDLALWNILGSPNGVAAFIDFDDSISGDPMDDLSLLACFHSESFLARAFEGYSSVRRFPAEHMRRFWLHLLRNMIVKAVIRIGAGYFERDSRFFLIGTGATGEDLRQFTLKRLHTALYGLNHNSRLSIL